MFLPYFSARSPREALIWLKATYLLAVNWEPALFYHYVSNFCNTPSRTLLKVNYFVGCFFSLLIPTSLYISGTQWVFGTMYFVKPGFFYYPFGIWWAGMCVWSHILLFREYRRGDPHKKEQVKYFALGSIVGFGSGSLLFLPVFGIELYPWSNFTIPLYTVIMSYAILKHQLMDVRLVIRKTLIYSVVTGILAVIIVFVAIVSAHFTQGLVGKQTTALVLTACLITAIFHPLQLKIQAFVDRYLFRDWADRPIVREVASGFSHELKSPLAGLSMQAQLMMAEIEDLKRESPSMGKKLAKLDEGVRYILNQAMDAARRIEAVRGVAEPTRGQMEPVNVAHLMDSSLSTLSSMMGQVNVDIQRDLPTSLAQIHGDGKQLEIVFINLMKNALQAMDGHNGSHPHSLLIKGEERNGSVVIFIKDTGPGIAAKDINRIFEPYYTTKGHKGTGMGLYLAQQIVRAHNGTIDVKSETGKGTEFVVLLPRYVANAAA